LGIDFQFFKIKPSAPVSWPIPFTLIKVTFNNEENRTAKIGATLPRWGKHYIEQNRQLRVRVLLSAWCWHWNNYSCNHK